MVKTITVRLDDKIYEMFKKAADGQKRTISNYIECAALNYNFKIAETETFDKKIKAPEFKSLYKQITD